MQAVDLPQEHIEHSESSMIRMSHKCMSGMSHNYTQFMMPSIWKAWNQHQSGLPK